jgi:CMP-N,N'-diacetyllegionaminic acid synthase
VKFLYVIPARGGSKGVPGKNVKLLGGKPLIYYSIEVARALTEDENICLSTDDEKIRTVAEDIDLVVPFLRPAELATDNAGTYEVLLHALQHYQLEGKEFDALVLLQPTSPFRKPWQVQEAIELWEAGIDMIVSVKETKSNPYYVLFEENADGFLEKSKKGNFKTRQECPRIYELNGAIYVMDVNSLKKQPIASFSKIKKYIMDHESSIDIDTPMDWKIAELLVRENIS